MKDQSISVARWTEQSHIGRLVLLTVLALLLQYPVYKVERLIGEREQAQRQAEAEVAGKWGREQRLAGPVIVLPYEKARYDAQGVGRGFERCYFLLLPESLNITAQTDHELRQRGAFEVPLFQAAIAMTGEFNAATLQTEIANADKVLWEQASLVVLVSDARAIQQKALLRWNDTELAFRPGVGFAHASAAGYHTPLPDFSSNEQYRFALELHLNGSKGIRFNPSGKDTEVTIASSWPHPRFEGDWLPNKREISELGFSASWAVPYLARGFDQTGLMIDNFVANADRLMLGVDLIRPVEPYRMTERSTKYSLLFIVLTYTAMWLYEVILKLRIHVMQYVLTGAALCLFYLLLLSFAEHIGFGLAYSIASIAVVGMLCSYAVVMLGTRRRSLALGGGIGLLYGYLFTLLREQDYALLAGSIGLFVMLGGVMYATRNVRWSKTAETVIDRGENKDGPTASAAS